MFHENEIVMLLLCIGIMGFIFFNWKNLARFNKWGILFTSFLLFSAACVSTVAEGFLMEGFFNYLEHACYTGSAIILLIWIYRGIQENSD